MAGYEVLLAEDGKSAVDMAWQQQPDLVLTDGLLPKLHGFFVCQRIKSFPNPPRVVLLTGVYTKPSYSWEVKKEYGADALMTKPFEVADLLDSVSEQLRLAARNGAAA
jgi:DNA-binding response OmpR family regulator